MTLEYTQNPLNGGFLRFCPPESMEIDSQQIIDGATSGDFRVLFGLLLVFILGAGAYFGWKVIQHLFNTIAEQKDTLHAKDAQQIELTKQVIAAEIESTHALKRLADLIENEAERRNRQR